MAGRSAQKALETPLNAPVVVYCDVVGCEQKAFFRRGDKNVCQACDARLHTEASEAACKAKGLDTVEKQRAYCQQLMRSMVRRPIAGGFQRWADRITQAGVDRLVLMGGKSDEEVLEKLRDVGAIDGRNRVIPAGEAREVAREAQRAERARQIAKVQQDLEELARKFGTGQPSTEPQAEPKA